MVHTAVDRSYYPPLGADVAAWQRPYTAGPLTEDEYEQFFQDGFVVKHNVLSDEQLKSVIAGIERTVEEVAQELFQAVLSFWFSSFELGIDSFAFQGKITSLYEDVGFYQRLTAIDKEFPGASVLLHKRGILPPEIASLWSGDVLLGAAKQLLGPNVAGHPVWNLRSKVHSFPFPPHARADDDPYSLVEVPNQEQATVPWHQDTACKNLCRCLPFVSSILFHRFESRMLESVASDGMDSVARRQQRKRFFSRFSSIGRSICVFR